MGWLGDCRTDYACQQCDTLVKESELKAGRCDDGCRSCRGKSCRLRQVPPTPPDPQCKYCGTADGYEHDKNCGSKQEAASSSGCLLAVLALAALPVILGRRCRR